MRLVLHARTRPGAARTHIIPVRLSEQQLEIRVRDVVVHRARVARVAADGMLAPPLGRECTPRLEALCLHRQPAEHVELEEHRRLEFARAHEHHVARRLVVRRPCASDAERVGHCDWDVGRGAVRHEGAARARCLNSGMVMSPFDWRMESNTDTE